MLADRGLELALELLDLHTRRGDRRDQRDHELPAGGQLELADATRGRAPQLGQQTSMLLERVATRARSVGIEQLTAICLASNLKFIRLVSRLGATTVEPSAAGLVNIRIDLI